MTRKLVLTNYFADDLFSWRTSSLSFPSCMLLICIAFDANWKVLVGSIILNCLLPGSCSGSDKVRFDWIRASYIFLTRLKPTMLVFITVMGRHYRKLMTNLFDIMTSELSYVECKFQSFVQLYLTNKALLPIAKGGVCYLLMIGCDVVRSLNSELDKQACPSA